MIRDKGPNYVTGFGTTSQDIPFDHTSDEGASSEEGILSRRLHDHPVMRFFTTSALTMAGIAVAGGLVRKGGVNLAAKWGRELIQADGSIAGGFKTEVIHSARKLQSLFDDWEGINREISKIPGTDIDNIFDFAGDQGGEAASTSGFFYSRARRLRMKEGSLQQSAEEWTFKDELRRSMVRQARRMPYELPAAYATQRFLIDPIVGQSQEDRANRPKWYNPFDVLGDFAQQSFKNMAQLLVPLDAGGAAAGEGWRRFMDMADYSGSSALKQRGREASIMLSKQLELVGHDASTLLFNTAKFSSRSSGAFGAAINDSIAQSKGLVQHLHEVRSSVLRERGETATLKDYLRYKAGDVQVGPFGGMNAFVKTFKKSWAEYEAPTGNSVFERIAASTYDLGRGGVESKEFNRGTFYRQRMNASYRDMLERNLIRANVDPKVAADAVRKLDVVSLPSASRDDGRVLSNRLAFGDKPNFEEGIAAWNAEFARRLNHLDSSGKLGEWIGPASRSADREFKDALKDGHLEGQIKSEWTEAYQNQILPFVKGRLKGTRPAQEMVDQGLDVTDVYNLRRMAEKLNIKSNDIGEIRRSITNLGFNLRDEGEINAFLQTNKLVQSPWNSGGYNLFGLRPLTIQRAEEIGYFNNLPPEMRREVQSLIGGLRPGDDSPIGLGGLQIGGVFERRMKNAKASDVVDFSPIGRSFRHAMNLASSDVQIPLLHISPFKLLGYESRRAFAESPMIQMETGTSGLPFLGDTKIGNTESVLFMKSKRSKGQLYRVGSQIVDGELQTYSSKISDDLYRSMPTNNLHLRLGIGDKGHIPDEPATGWRKAFHIDEDQPDSLARLFSRWKDRNTDLRNPHTYARRLLAGDLADVSNPEQAEAFLNFVNDFRSRGLSPKLISRLEAAAQAGELPEDLAHIFSPDASIASMKRPEDVVKFARRMMAQDRPNDIFSNPDSVSQLYTAQRKVQARLRAATEERYFEKNAHPQLQRAGIHRRLDEFKNELYQYVVARAGIVANDAGRSPAGVIEEMLDVIDDYKAKGILNGKEATEARAAVLGMQVNLARTVASGVTDSTAAGLTSVAHSLTDPGVGSIARQARELLREYAEYGASDSINFRTPGGRDVRWWTDQPAQGQGFGKMVNVVGRSIGAAKWAARRSFNASPYEYPGVTYNPFGGGQEKTFVPTFGTAFRRNPLKATASVLQLNSWSSPESFSGSSMIGGHFFQRLNRVFSTFSMGLDETKYKGGADFYVRGLVMRRALPIVAGMSALYAADSTLGGLTGKKDENGDRVYSPLFLGLGARGVAEGQAALAGVLPGGQTYEQKRDEIFSGDVPVRRGRWWPLGNTPWRGDRIQYFRPSWYRRFRSGYKYTDQMYGSPLGHLAFDEDFSPLRPLDPYHFERKHYADRPYPVTGEYFSGPWGPLTGALNATVGKVLKPGHTMHDDELRDALSRYQAIGSYAAQAPPPLDEAGRVLVRTAKRQTVQIPMAAKAVLGLSPLGYGKPMGEGGGGTLVAGAGGGGGAYILPGRASNDQQVAGGVVVGGGGGGQQQPVMQESSAMPVGGRASGITRGAMLRLNQMYADAGSRPILGRRDAYGSPVLTNTDSLTARRIARAEPMDPTSLKYQTSQVGYQLQELFGIYGFGFGAARQALGLGTQDFSFRKPILASPSRAYGSERAFWDMNLGGFGDFPTPLEGEYGNLEVSEIARRFIPHRRRDENEINPIPNQMGQKYPWLPANDYFLNFHEGDPYAQIQEGEMRLPGKGYERFNKLHSDSTGRYGLVDKFKILGDVAPWSNQYSAMEKLLQVSNLTPQEKDVVRDVKKEVRAKKKTTFFSPYRYAYQDFKTEDVTVDKFVPGRADQFITDKFGPEHPIRLSGVRASRKNASMGAISYMKKYVQPGEKVSITYDANKGPVWNQMGTVDVYMKNAQGENVNERLLNSGYGKTARIDTPLDVHMTESPLELKFKSLGEKLAHRNTFVNAKFLPNRTAVEDWERRNVYGATFPQWQHPIRDFLKPMVYRAANRDVFSAAVALGTAGSMFGHSAAARRIGAMIGGTIGIATSLFTDTGTQQTGTRFIPKTRKKELALEEYTDILKYVKYERLYGQAREAAIQREHVDPESLVGELPEGSRRFTPIGPITSQALQYRKETKRTMYGADPFGDMMDLYQAIPKRKRKYFMEFIKAPISERPRILSTAGRLERRIYESRWGLRVEKRPDLVNYFSERELPNENWEGWQPNVNLDTVKLKIANHMGLDASQMGYYPQQVREANLLNPSYPDFDKQSPKGDVEAQLRRMLSDSGIQGNVRAIPTPFAGTRVNFNAGVS